MQTSGLTIVFDNYPHLPGFQTLWGFAAVIHTPGGTLLFDTGSNGRVLLRNLQGLGIAPESIDLLFLSHPHWDHIGGLDSFLEINPRATVVVHEGFSKHLLHDLRGLCGALIVVGEEPLPLGPGLHSTGMLAAEPPEHALVVESDYGPVVISGCAHPGMERIVERATAMTGSKVRLAVGGFHLMYADAVKIEQSILALQRLGVEFVLPTHCSGDLGIEAFKRRFGKRCFSGGIGREIRFDGLST